MCRAVEHLSKVEGDSKAMRSLRPRQVKQAVKAVCALLGGLVTLDVQVENPEHAHPTSTSGIMFKSYP